MTRKALIVINPGEKGAENYCAGVYRDSANYKQYFLSPLGGFWSNSEITAMERPTRSQLLSEVQSLTQDYSIIVFCGHGCFDNSRKETAIELSKGIYCWESDLKAKVKRTIILDCCRKPTFISLNEGLRINAAMGKFASDGSKHRKAYDDQINKCLMTNVTLYSCSINETAGDNSSLGGIYTFNLLNVCEQWGKCNMLIALVGKKMSSASGVAKEISMAKDQDVPVFGVYVDGASATSTLPEGLPRTRTISWDWAKIAAMIDQVMREGKNKK